MSPQDNLQPVEPMKKNLLDMPAGWSEATEHTEVLAAGPDLRLERIISKGHTTPPGHWYDQPEAEWVVLLQGEATLQWEDGSSEELMAGDWVFIAAHRRHRVTATTSEPPCVWLAVHGPLEPGSK